MTLQIVTETLERLVGFDTVSRNSNLGIIDFIDAFCRERGAETHRIPRAPGGEVGVGRSGAGKGDKCGLVARFGPAAAGGILLSGHTDVVPVDGQEWSVPAFSLTERGQRLYGRGTTDMKGFLACMLAAGDMARGVGLKKPLTLVFSYDEEIGCVGINEMRPFLKDLLGAPKMCIVGEPTEMRVAVGHKGKAVMTARFTGQAGHSALAPRFVNALHMAADFITELRRIEKWLQEHGARDPDYDIPHTTLHVGRLSGGTALNMVPELAELEFECRYLSGDGEEASLMHVDEAAARLQGEYRKTWPGAQIDLERVCAYPGLDAPSDCAARRAALDLSPAGEATKVAFGTEAGVFAGFGIPTVVCGPGSMAGQGHKPDEYIEIRQLQMCYDMMVRVVEDLR